MGDNGNEYDTAPPAASEAGQVGGAVQSATVWLKSLLKEPSGLALTAIREAFEKKGISVDSMYKAGKALGITEYTSQGRKWWKLPATDEKK